MLNTKLIRLFIAACLASTSLAGSLAKADKPYYFPHLKMSNLTQIPMIITKRGQSHNISIGSGTSSVFETTTSLSFPEQQHSCTRYNTFDVYLGTPKVAHCWFALAYTLQLRGDGSYVVTHTYLHNKTHPSRKAFGCENKPYIIARLRDDAYLVSPT